MYKSLDFLEFIKKNFTIFKTKLSYFFVPKDLNNNIYRSFGIKTSNKLYLSQLEVIYLYFSINSLNFNSRAEKRVILQSLDHNLKKTIEDYNFTLLKSYFYIKKNYNLIQNHSDLFLYSKNKDFNRKKDLPIAKVELKRHKDHIKDIFGIKNKKVFFIYSDDEFCILSINYIEELTFNTKKNLFKF